MNSISTKLDAARQELLDLGFRNTLINYRTLKSRGLEIVDELPVETFRILVREGKKMSFLSVPETEEADEKEQEGQDELFELFEQPEEEEEGLAARHTDTKLQTSYTSVRLQRRLLNTYYAARSFIEEQGVNVLYLALGMLEWYEAPSSDKLRRAPLILMPAELTRTSVQAKFRIEYSGEDIGENLSLYAKLKSEFGIEMPTLPDMDDLDVPSYFDAVEQAISGFERWHVNRDAINLGFFLFGKLLMYNDLDVSQWPDETSPAKHSVIRALLLDEGFEEPETRIDDEEHLDSHLHPEEVHHVMDADGSQTLAMLDVKQGHNLVIQGPPGTGKSQTITNLIAEAIGQGKTVLFVSEKMAALEVVKRRLDSIHLGDACLELHSHKTRKKAILDELERTLRLGRPKAEAFEQDLGVLLSARKEINTYCQAVNTPIGKSGITPYRAYGRLLRIQQRLDDIESPVLDTSAMREWTAEEFKEREAIAEQLESLVVRMGMPVKHPFWGSRRKVFLPTDKPQIVRAAQDALDATRQLKEASHVLSSTLGLETPQTPEDASILCRAARRAMAAPDLVGVELSTKAWHDRRVDLKALLDAGTRNAELHATYDELLIPQAWTQDMLETRQHLAAHGEKWWRFFIGDFRRAKSKLAGLCRQPLPKDAHERVAVCDAIMEAHEMKAEIDMREELGRTLYGAQWQQAASDWPVLRQITIWMQELYTDIEGGTIPSGLVAFLAGGPDLDSLEPLVAAVEQKQGIHAESIAVIIDALELDERLRYGKGKRMVAQPFAQQEKALEAFAQEIDRLQEMVAFVHRADALAGKGGNEIVGLAATWPHAAEHLVNAFRQAWLSGLVERAMKERPVLAQFEGATHNEVVKKFRKLDSLSLAYNRARLALAHWRSLPRTGVSGQMGILRREFEKKRRHLPIRQLIEQAGHAMQAIKPVFMMSPMSIATYLPPGSAEFDLVVFDEASQVKPVEAFGAILRGKQTVVVGDRKQLPPTSFFDSMTADEESDTTTADMESILGLFNAQGAPERMLRWHYRSRHDSLIAVSNQEFYDNRLVTFPSPDAARQELGLRYHFLLDTHYDRGGSRTNRGEAQAVAQAVMEHARQRPDWTLGVATFSTAQMQEVLDQIELLRRQDPTCESFFTSHEEEPFFVKNLENVQGDERDVIFISVGYGRDANGYLTMNFGPLNQDGGERRLNVLITRARRRCEVFTNLRADDIDLNRTSARGVEALKRYLQYAATGELEMATPTGGDADSPFEEAVADALKDLGYRVVHQVGSAGFRVDLAIVDDERPGHYLLGIECDGATYHSARTARDRDRIRQSVLEGLGWHIHRIWSTDWFRNPHRELKKVVEAIERAKAHSHKQSPPQRDSSSNSRTLEREALEDATLEHPPAPPYKMATLRVRSTGLDLHEVPVTTLADLVKQVVEVESPVHFEEVARRILSAYGVTRLGRRIREALERAVQHTKRQDAIEQLGDFLYWPLQEKIVVRDRSDLDNSSRKIEFIAPFEIQVAAEKVIRESFGIAQEDVPLEVCRLFGFAQTSENMRQHIQGVLETLVKKGRLVDKGGHLVLAST